MKKPRVLVRAWLSRWGIKNPSGRDVIRYREREPSAQKDPVSGLYTVHADAPSPKRVGGRPKR